MDTKLSYTRANDEDGTHMQRNRLDRRKASLFAWAIPLALLSACTTPTKEVVFVEPEVLAEVAALAQEQEPAEAEKQHPVAAGPRKPLPPLTLTTIVGRDEAQTMELLGQPEQVRVESPATIWTYRRGECRLEIYFYPSLRERRLQSLTYEISGPDDQTDCLNEFGMTEDGTS